MAKIIEKIKDFFSGRSIFTLKKKEETKTPQEESKAEKKPKGQK